MSLKRFENKKIANAKFLLGRFISIISGNRDLKLPLLISGADLSYWQRFAAEMKNATIFFAQIFFGDSPKCIFLEK